MSNIAIKIIENITHSAKITFPLSVNYFFVHKLNNKKFRLLVAIIYLLITKTPEGMYYSPKICFIVGIIYIKNKVPTFKYFKLISTNGLLCEHYLILLFILNKINIIRMVVFGIIHG